VVQGFPPPSKTFLPPELKVNLNSLSASIRENPRPQSFFLLRPRPSHFFSTLGILGT